MVSANPSIALPGRPRLGPGPGTGPPVTVSSAGDPPLERNPSSSPRDFSKGIIASVRFSHSLDPELTSTAKEVGQINALHINSGHHYRCRSLAFLIMFVSRLHLPNLPLWMGCWHVDALHTTFANHGRNSAALTCQSITYIRSRQPGRARRSLEFGTYRSFAARGSERRHPHVREWGAGRSLLCNLFRQIKVDQAALRTSAL